MVLFLWSTVLQWIMQLISLQSLYRSSYSYHTPARLVWVTSQELRGGVRVCTSPVCYECVPVTRMCAPVTPRSVSGRVRALVVAVPGL